MDDDATRDLSGLSGGGSATDDPTVPLAGPRPAADASEPTSPPRRDAAGPNTSPDTGPDSGGTMPPLLRPKHGRTIAGVCAAIGRATRTDPVLWRVLLAVLVLFWGVGLLVYLVAWLLIPEEGDTASPLESLIGRGRSSTSTGVAILLCVGVLAIFGFQVRDGFGPALFVAALLGIGIVLLSRKAAVRPPPAADVETAPASGYRPPFAPHGPYVPLADAATTELAVAVPDEPPPRPRRRRNPMLFRVTACTALAVVGALALVDLAGPRIPVAGYLAAALAVVGLGLVVGAFAGQRGSSLILIGVLLTLGTGIASAADRVHWDAAFTEYRTAPAAAVDIQRSYDIAFSSARIDLRGVDFREKDVRTRVDVTFGEAIVLLPKDVDVEVRADATMADWAILGHEPTGGNDDHTIRDAGADGAGDDGRLRLDVDVSFGHVEVLR